MSQGGLVIFITVFVVVLVVVVALAVALRPRVQRRLYAGTGVERWQSTASGLPWADRWVLFWASSWGRTVPRRLADLAVERGEVMLAMTERMLAKGSKVRRIWLWLGGFWVVLALLNIGNFVFGDGGWLNLIAPVLGLATVFLAIGPAQAWQARLIRRSVELNRQQQEEGRGTRGNDGP